MDDSSLRADGLTSASIGLFVPTHHVGINFSGADIGVAQEILNRSNVATGLQQIGKRIGMMRLCFSPKKAER